MAYGQVGIDLPGIFVAAQQAKAAQERNRLAQLQRSQLEQAAQIQQLLPEARQYAAQGRPEMLRMLAPQEVESMEAAAREQQTARQNLALKLAGEQRAQQKAALGGLSREWISAFNSLYGQVTPEKLQALTQEQIMRINQAMEQTQTRKAPKTDIKVTSGPSGEQLEKMLLTKPQISKVQERLRATEDLIFEINELRKLGSPGQFVGLIPKSINWLRSMQDWVIPQTMTPEAREAVGKARKFQEVNESLFNALRRLITGAQASEKELQHLRKTIVNTKLSESEYTASLNRLEDFNRRANAVAKKLLKEGLDITSKDYGRRFDEEMGYFEKKYSEKQGQRYRGENLQAPLLDTASQVVTDAMAAGADPEQAISSLINAGKLDQEGARQIRKRLLQQGRARGGAR